MTTMESRFIRGLWAELQCCMPVKMKGHPEDIRSLCLLRITGPEQKLQGTKGKKFSSTSCNTSGSCPQLKGKTKP